MSEYFVVDYKDGYCISRSESADDLVSSKRYMTYEIAEYFARLLEHGPICCRCGNKQDGILRVSNEINYTSKNGNLAMRDWQTVYFAVCLTCALHFPFTYEDTIAVYLYKNVQMAGRPIRLYKKEK